MAGNILRPAAAALPMIVLERHLLRMHHIGQEKQLRDIDSFIDGYLDGDGSGGRVASRYGV
ncbi:MAG: hypothetical protein H0W59_01925 [Chloroflexia bacterium]|nr:hypothetical protein [Chloroflexia bacterium]